MKTILLSAMLLASTTIVSAQQELTLSQLTPGSPEFLYPKGLLNTHWDEKGKFQFTMPEDAATAKSIAKKDTVLEKIEKEWRESLPKEEGIVYGKSVHRNEFGIDGGIFWSPNKERMAFYRMDESMVQSYPLVQTDDREATVKWVKYPMAGMTSHQVTLGIYNPATGETLYIKSKIEDPEHYLTCVTWRPDSKQIFIAELNRKQNFMELNCYDAMTGEYVETLFTESAQKYVEPEHPLYFIPGSNDLFVWQDERDGWDHLYLYDLKQPRTQTILDQYHHYEGVAPVRQLTQGDWLVTELFGADAKGKELFFMATKEDPRESHLYALNLKNGKMRNLTPEPGIHRIKLSPDYSEFYDAYSNPDTPRRCQLVNVRSGKANVLYSATNPYEGFWRPTVETGTLKSADGVTDLYYRLVLPKKQENDAKDKKYPVVVYLYNGPHAQLVTEGFEHGLPGWDAYMAQRGYAVFTIDGRGSANRGLAFEQAIWHHLGEAEAADQLEGVKYLKSLPFIDADRIGIYGWSYGGFMTTYMKLNYPEIFKVGVCGGPVLDWSRYEVMYGERYMGTPQDNAEGYKKNCLINQASKLQGKLLVIHDDQDDTVVPQMSIQFLKNSVETGTYPDFLLYANHPHNVRGKDRVHLLTRIAQYFIDNL